MTHYLGELPTFHNAKQSSRNNPTSSSHHPGSFHRLDIHPSPPRHRHSVLVAGAPLVDNPFSNNTWTTRPCAWKFVEMIGFFTLFPIRLVIILVAALVILPPSLFLLRLCRCFDSPPPSHAADSVDDYAVPHSCGRRLFLFPVRLLARIALWCLGVWWIDYVERPGCAQSTGEIKVLVANHCAFIDAIWAFFWAAPMVVAKEELVTLPIINSVIIGIQGIFVKRNDPLDKKKVIVAIKKRTTTQGFPPLLVFPEGTCTNGKMLIQFKKGAFVGGTPVQAVRIEYIHPFISPAAVGDFDSIAALWRLMIQPYVSMRVTLLPLHYPSEAEKKDADRYAATVRANLAKEMNCKMTEHSYDDMFLRMFANAENITLHQNFEAGAMQNLFKLDFEGLKGLLLRFSALDVDKKGYLTKEQVCKAMNVADDDDEAHTIFDFFDTDGTGNIHFAAFVRGISLLSDKLEDVDRLRLAFHILDRDSTGRVKLSDLTIFLDEAIEARRRLSQISEGQVGDTQRRQSSASSVGLSLQQQQLQEEKDMIEKQSKLMGQLEQESKQASNNNDSATATAADARTKREKGGEQDEGAVDNPRPRLVRSLSLVECFEAMDADKDGAVTYEEFLQFVNARNGLDTHIIQSVKNLASKLHTPN